MSAKPPHDEHWNPDTPEGIIALMEHLTNHIDKRFDELEKMLRSSVPNGDIDGHRRAHEQWLHEAEARREMRNKVLIKLAEGTAWAIVSAIAIACWFWVKEHVK